MRRNKQIDVRRALALTGLFNFLIRCARASLLPFLTLYFRQLGLPPVMIGVIIGVKHLISLIWSPVSSLLSKHYNKRRAAIMCALVFSAALPQVLLLMPSVDPNAMHHTGTCNLSNASGEAPHANNGNLLTSSAGPATTIPTTVKYTPRNKTTGFVSQPGTTVSANALSNTKPASVVTINPILRSTSKPRRESASVVVGGGHGEPTISGTNSATALVRNKRSQLESESAGNVSEEEYEVGFDFLSSLKAMDPQHQLFFLALIAVSLWECASAPLDWTADDGLYEYLDYADASDRYDSSGMWGLLGAACGVGGAGLLISRLSCFIAGQTPRSAVHFYCYACLAALALPVAAYLPLYLNKKRDRANGLLKAVQLVRGSPRALLCAVSTLLVGAAGSTVDDFLFWQMQDQGSSELQMGLALALAHLSQAAFPLLAGQLSKLLSPRRVLALGVASLGVQCFYYSFLWGPWAALPAQVLSCFSSGALWWAVKVQCEDVATPGAQRSVRRVYSALSLNLGNGLGSFAAGLVVQSFGVTWLFRGAAAVLVLWCVCLPLLQWNSPRQRRINYSRLLAADASEASDTESDQEKDWLDKAMENDGGNNNEEWRVNH